MEEDIYARPLTLTVTERSANVQVSSNSLVCSCRTRGSAAEESKPNFLRDVAPILNKAGCTSGPCHGAAKGKNGFKLSLAATIRTSITSRCSTTLSGRRFNRADPARSLMLAKPTQEVAHGGGLRFEANSRYYKDHLRLDRRRRALRRSAAGFSGSARSRAEADLHAGSRRGSHGAGDRSLRRRHDARRHRGCSD